MGPESPPSGAGRELTASGGNRRRALARGESGRREVRVDLMEGKHER